MGKVYDNLRVFVILKNELTVEAAVNGEQRILAQGTTLLDLVNILSLEPERLAIELNHAIVKRPLWASTPVGNGSQIEIVQFVGGG